MKKFLSKLLSVFLVVLFVFSFSACSYEISPSKSDDFAIVNEAYTNLNSAYSEINTAMSIVSSSWGFSVTCGTKFNASGWSGSSYSYVDTAYANSIGVDYGDVVTSFRNYYGEDLTASRLYPVVSNISYANGLVQQIIKDKGIYDSIDSKLESAKSSIKNISKENEYCNDIVEYYTELTSYYDFVKSPTGSYSSLSGTVSSYESKIDSIKNKLSIYFD